MSILRTRYSSGEDFLRQYLPSLTHGGIFFPTRQDLAESTPVLVEIRFPELGDRMMLRGTVAWRRPGRHVTKLRAGVAVEFDSGEAERRDFLLAVAKGLRPSFANARKHRRLPVDMEASWRVTTERGSVRGRLADIGLGGAFVISDLNPPRGAEVVLDVTPPRGERPLAITSRVAWVRPQTGFGIEFRWRDGGGARRIRELVRRLEATAEA